MNKKLTVPELEALSKKTRAHLLKMIHDAKSGHPGGSLSSVEIMLSLYFNVMNRDPNDPEHDRFVLSKGHSAPLFYTVLMEAGYIPESTDQLRLYGSILQGHPDAMKTKGVEISSGSLGNGLSVAAGIAAAAKIDGKKTRVYCLLGDGECDEGLVWEAAMTAPSRKLDNLTAIVDRNMLQIDGCTEDVVCLEPFPDKWKAFNWNVIECDGHSFDELLDAFKQAASHKGQPTVIVAHTTKGKGVSFMENNVGFHGKAPNDEEMAKALSELGED
ncbi:MAG: transketolase [Candidatus Bathyarchaeota archaeon]|nr:transketolase [Candidatus Bathyarchaeota archaeon]